MDTPLPEPPRPTGPPTLEPPPLPLVSVGNYELLLELASGGMAVVHLGRATDGRGAAPLVAVKRPHRHLATDKNFLAMLLDEARLASAIAHENVVKVRELQFHEGEPFIVMDYVEGASLSELRKELASAGRAIDVKVALRIVLDALAGLHAAHELADASGKPLGIVHRDISPHNVLVGSDGRARLTDFGIAQAVDRLQETRSQEIKGKLAYLAPERVDRRRLCTKQSDVFSMAIVLWECLAGRRLFRGDQAVDTLQEVMHAPIPRLRQIGLTIAPALDDALAKALSRDLDVRFATARDFAVALERAAGPALVGEPAEVAHLIEALYGARMADRHEAVRRALGDDEVANQLLDATGLPRRAKPVSPSAPNSLEVLREIAPAAPSERYVFGDGVVDYHQVGVRRTRWAVALGIAGGLLLGAMSAAFFVLRVHPAPVPRADLATVKVPASTPATPWRTDDVPRAAATRHVEIPLPFLAMYVTVDGVGHQVAPASDVLAVDLPVESPTSHQIVATALDGTLARATVVEQGGLVRVSQGTFVLGASPLAEVAPEPPLAVPETTPQVAPVLPSSTRLPPEARPPLRRPGSVRDGFTKLR